MVKAVSFSRFGGPEVLEMVDLPDPHPGSGQVRIAVRAAGVKPERLEEAQWFDGWGAPADHGL